MERDHREAIEPETTEVASSSECTGLISALPHSDEAADAAASMYAIHSVSGSRRKLYRRK